LIFQSQVASPNAAAALKRHRAAWRHQARNLTICGPREL
jgi:hypothetical protein